MKQFFVALGILLAIVAGVAICLSTYNNYQTMAEWLGNNGFGVLAATGVLCALLGVYILYCLVFPAAPKQKGTPGGGSGTTTTPPQPQTTKTSPSWLGWVLAVPLAGLVLWGATALVSSTWHSYAEVEKERVVQRQGVKKVEEETLTFTAYPGVWSAIKLPDHWFKYSSSYTGRITVANQSKRILHSGYQTNTNLGMTSREMWITSLETYPVSITFTKK